MFYVTLQPKKTIIAETLLRRPPPITQAGLLPQCAYGSCIATFNCLSAVLPALSAAYSVAAHLVDVIQQHAELCAVIVA